MKNFGKQLAVLGILLFGLAMLAFIGCSTGTNPTDEWTVKFNLDGGKIDGEDTIPDVKVPKGSSLDNQYPEDPTKAGSWSFGGWFDSDASTEKYEADTPINKDITLKAKWNNTDPDKLEIKITITGNTAGDSVTVDPDLGSVGDEVTISYTLSGGSTYNQLNFSGITSVTIESVTTAGSDTIEYTIAEEDAIDGVITINAIFTHSNKQIVTMAFEHAGNQTVTYGDDEPFTNAISGLTGISYESSDGSVATVNNSGTITILKVGNTTITATKEEDDKTYTPAVYDLIVEPLQLTIGTPTITPKQYDGNATANVTAGALAGVVSGDTVNVHATGTYATTDAGTGINVTVTYTIDGASAGNYIKPVNGIATGAITKANGGTVTVPTMASNTANSITVNAVTVTPPYAYGQNAEYTISSTISTVAGLEGTEIWQEELTFTGLNASTDYYVFARAKENTNYNAGTPQVSAAIKTNDPPVVTKYNFATDTLPNTYPKIIVGNNSSTMTAEIEGGVLKVVKTSTNNGNIRFVLPFNVGEKKLSDYPYIAINIRGVNITTGTNVNDYGNKPLDVLVDSTAAGTTLGTVGNSGISTSFQTVIVPTTSSVGSGYGGAVDIGFMLRSANGFTIEITGIELVPYYYNFATDSLPNNYPAISGATGNGSVSGGVLTITKTATNFNLMKFALPFDLGGKNLSNYSKISVNMRGVGASPGGDTTDYNNKNWNIEVGSPAVLLGSNVSSGLNETFKDVDLNITLSTASSYGGAIDLNFILGNGSTTKGFTIEIKSITLIPKL
jgi:hypothetical protein